MALSILFHLDATRNDRARQRVGRAALESASPGRVEWFALLAEGACQPRTGAAVGGDRLIGDQCLMRTLISQCARRTARLNTGPNGSLAGADVSVQNATRNNPVVPDPGEHRLVLVLRIRPV